MFEVGDLVQYVGVRANTKDKIGIVRIKPESIYLGVEFFDNIDGHNLSGSGKNGHCAWMREDRFIKINNKQLAEMYFKGHIELREYLERYGVE